MSHWMPGLGSQACYKVFVSKMTSEGQRWMWHCCVSYLIQLNKAFLYTVCSICKPIASCFCVVSSASFSKRRPSLTLRVSWIWSQLPALACFWQLSGTDKGMAEFAHSFERRRLSETQSACGLPLETLSHVGPKENICVCVCFGFENEKPLLTLCASSLTLGCFRNDAVGSWRKRHCLL